jgi:hypothetical protein
MFKFDHDIPFSSFVDLEISNVNFDHYGVKIAFDGSNAIYSKFRDFLSEINAPNLSSDGDFIALIGQKFIRYNIINSSKLIVEFSESVIAFEEFEDEFELYVFTINGVDYVV